MLTAGAPPVPRGHERRVTMAVQHDRGLPEAMAVLEERAPAGAARNALREGPAAAAPRATWTLRWLDAREVQGRVRSWTGPAPEGAGVGAFLLSVAALGDRALFVTRAAGREHLVIRTKPGGGVEAAEVPAELLPGEEVAFGEAPDGPIAWLRGASLVVWSAGEAPRAIASLVTGGKRALGQPTRAGVPLLLTFRDLSISRTVPLPPPQAGAEGAPPRAAPLLPLGGWEIAPTFHRELSRLPACGARPSGARFFLGRASASAVLDGRDVSVEGLVHDVRVAGAHACVAGVAARLRPERPSHEAGARPAPGELTFVRADFAAGRAEGVQHGLDEGARRSARRLACSLEARP